MSKPVYRPRESTRDRLVAAAERIAPGGGTIAASTLAEAVGLKPCTVRDHVIRLRAAGLWRWDAPPSGHRLPPPVPTPTPQPYRGWAPSAAEIRAACEAIQRGWSEWRRGSYPGRVEHDETRVHRIVIGE